MKKTNFLKGLAMAAIALVSVFTTSCSEEELSIKGTEVKIPELAAPVATVSISVVDFEKGALLQTSTEDASANIGGTYTVNCPSLDGFTTAKAVTISIPNIAKGQAIVIPVTFYVVPVGSALEEVIESLNGNLEVVETLEAEELEAPTANITANEEGAFVNDGDEAIVLKATFSYYTGYELYSEGKSISAADLAKLQPELVTETFEFQMAPNTIITFNPTQEKEVVILPLDGAEYKLIKYGKFSTGMQVTSIEHDFDHGHDHGHGNGNAGGGEGEAE